MLRNDNELERPIIIIMLFVLELHFKDTMRKKSGNKTKFPGLSIIDANQRCEIVRSIKASIAGFYLILSIPSNVYWQEVA